MKTPNPSTAKPPERMKMYHAGKGALTGFLLTVSFTAIMFMFYQLAGLPFLPFDFFDWMTRVLPGPVVTFGIDLMIDIFRFLGINVADAAKGAEQVIAVTQFLAGGTLISVFYFWIMNRKNSRPDVLTGILTGILVGSPFITISIAISQSTISPAIRILWLVLLFVAFGLILGLSFNSLVDDSDKISGQEKDNLKEIKKGRRKFIIQLSSISAGITLLGSFAGGLISRSKQNKIQDEFGNTLAHRTETGSGMPFPNLNDPVTPAPGTRPEYTPIKDHYKVYIRTEPTIIDGSKWILPITGLVEKPLMLSLNDIKNNYPKQSQYVTISCISGRIGTSLIGTTLWSGVSVQDVLKDAKVKPDAKYLYITAGDGFYESVELDSIYADKRIMLCYAWDGHDLPVEHGYPLRIWIPDRYGMKQPKWITGIEVTDKYKKGYWVERKWDETARVKATSVIDTVAVDATYNNGEKKLVPVGGIAFAGARGISAVEVRVDSGPWKKAKLRSPLSDTTWVIWRYDWPYEKGEHIFEVRCAEKDGTPQIEQKQSNRPSGATGIHSYKIKV